MFGNRYAVAEHAVSGYLKVEEAETRFGIEQDDGGCMFVPLAMAFGIRLCSLRTQCKCIAGVVIELEYQAMILVSFERTMLLILVPLASSAVQHRTYAR